MKNLGGADASIRKQESSEQSENLRKKKENIFEAEARKLQQSDVVYNASWINK